MLMLKLLLSLLNCSKTPNAITHKNNERIKPSLTEILPEAIGLFFVLSTLVSNFLSTISFIMQPAERIRTEPKKNKIK